MKVNDIVVDIGGPPNARGNLCRCVTTTPYQFTLEVIANTANTVACVGGCYTYSWDERERFPVLHRESPITLFEEVK